MNNNIVRKGHTGEPTSNAGHFGSRHQDEPNLTSLPNSVEDETMAHLSKDPRLTAVEQDGNVAWYEPTGELHLARIRFDDRVVYCNAKREPHNPYGPAIRYDSGATLYYVDDKLHRTDGPAIRFPRMRGGWHNVYCLNDIQYEYKRDWEEAKAEAGIA